MECDKCGETIYPYEDYETTDEWEVICHQCSYKKRRQVRTKMGTKIIHLAHVEHATEDDNNEYANPICNWDAEWEDWEYTTRKSEVTCKRCLKIMHSKTDGGKK